MLICGIILKIKFLYGCRIDRRSLLKVLSIEMDQAKIRFLQKPFIKERCAGFRKNARVPSLEPFKTTAPPRPAAANLETNSQRGNEIYRAVGIAAFPQPNFSWIYLAGQNL
jgi:hypothetical protein